MKKQSFRSRFTVNTLSAVIALVLLSACGGGSSGNRNNPYVPNTAADSHYPGYVNQSEVKRNQATPDGAEPGQAKPNPVNQGNMPTNDISQGNGNNNNHAAPTAYHIAVNLSEATTITNPHTNPDSTRIASLTPEQKAKIHQAFIDTNKLRKEVGVPPLEYDENLAVYAQKRTEEISSKFAHERPGNLRPLSGLMFYGEGEVTDGENIAAGSSSADSTVLNQWRNSKGHYDNIINKEFTKIGIGYALIPGSEFGYYWTQIFGGGEGNWRSAYHYSDALRLMPEMAQTLQDAAHVEQGKVVISGKPVNSNATLSFGSWALPNPVFRSSKEVSHGDFKAVIQDIAGTGFSYQTFAEIQNRQGFPVQYANIGIPTDTDKIPEIHAVYRGVSMGNMQLESHVYADVEARVDFGNTNRQMILTLNNTRFAYHDIKEKKPEQEVKGLSNPGTLNFTDRLDWDSQGQQFVYRSNNNDRIQAKFYGPQAEELGGIFKKGVHLDGSDATISYQGAFSAKRD